MKRLPWAVFFSIFFAPFAASCSYQLHLVNIRDGITLHGTYHVTSQRIEIELPSGSLLEGHAVLSDRLPPFYTGDATDEGPGISKLYAVLTDNQGTMMEATFRCSAWTGHGVGNAKTNKGDEYKIIF